MAAGRPLRNVGVVKKKGRGPRRPGKDVKTGLSNVELDTIRAVAVRNDLSERWINEAIAAKKRGRVYIKPDGTIQTLGAPKIAGQKSETAVDRQKQSIADRKKNQDRIKKAQKARAAENKKQKAYRKKPSPETLVAKKAATIKEIQKIDPFFGRIDGVDVSDINTQYSQAQLDTRLKVLSDPKTLNNLETLRQENPTLWESRLKAGKFRPDMIERDALYYINEGAGDPHAKVKGRQGPLGTVEKVLPDKLNQAELDDIAGKSGSRVRKEIETNRQGSPQYDNAQKWNKSVNSAAMKLEEQGFFKPGDSNVKVPPQYNAPGSTGKFLSNKDLWIAERTLDYGHLGSASNPGFHYVINYDSNGQPEFTRWNRETNASMTPAEYITADERIQGGRGYEWDKVNRGRFDKHLDEILDVLSEAEFEDLSKTLQYFDSVPDSPFHIDDPQRNYLNTSSGNTINKDIDSAYYLTNNSNKFTLDNYTRSQGVNERKAAIAARIAFMKGLPSVDLQAALQQGLLSPRMQTSLDINVDEESAKVQQLTNDEIKDLHRASIGVLKEGENLTIDQVLRRAVNKMGKTPWSLAALAAVTTNAYANAPADEKKLETLMRALQHYDNLGPGRGREMWAEGLKNVGLEGVGKYVDDSFKSGLNRVANIGKEKDSGYGKADEAVLNFVYESGKDIVAEPFGWIDSAGKWLNNWSEDSRTSSGVMQSPMQAQINASTQNNLDQQPLFNETFGVLQADQNRPIENLHSATNSPKVNAYIRQQRREDMAPYAGLLEDRFFTRPR